MLPTSQLATLIRRKHAVLAQLHELGQRQREVVEQDDTTTLLKLVATKQTMIGALQQVEQELAPFRAENPDERTWASPTERAECSQHADECNRLLQEIVELEQHCAERITSRRDEVAAQLQQVDAAGQARNAYLANQMPSRSTPSLPTTPSTPTIGGHA